MPIEDGLRTILTMITGHYYAKWDDSDGVSVVWEGMDVMDLALFMRPDDLDEVLANLAEG